MARTFDHYEAGRFNDKGPVLHIIRFWKPDGSFGSCQCVEDEKLQAELDALRKQGFEELSDEDEDDLSDTDPENIYNLPGVRQSIEEDRQGGAPADLRAWWEEC